MNEQSSHVLLAKISQAVAGSGTLSVGSQKCWPVQAGFKFHMPLRFPQSLEVQRLLHLCRCYEYRWLSLGCPLTGYLTRTQWFSQVVSRM
jgi:hypothetical protein